MNTPPNDSPELTAYALGELSPAQAPEVHAMLAAPWAQSELEQVEAITDALRQGAPIPQDRLTPGQRHAVLHPAPLPRLVVPMMPRQAPRRRPPVFWPAVKAFTQAAAVLAVTGVAFFLGRSMQLPEPTAAAASGSGAETPTPVVAAAAPAGTDGLEVPPPVEPPKTVAAALPGPTDPPPAAVPAKSEVVVLPASAPPPQEIAANSPPAPIPAAPPAVQIVAAAPVEKPAATPAPAAVAVLTSTTPPPNDAFVSASRQATDQFALHPAKIRPLPPKQDRSQQFASPAPAGRPAADSKAAKPRPGNLYIHSWKADVTSCPWNEAHRLLRVVIQLPADQPAVASADHSYPIQVNFDPTSVRDYRLLCERHQRAAELRSAGTHVIWYEFLPNGATEPTRENGKHVATVTLPGATFTTQTVEPFDGSKLRVLDRGQAWQAARDDFVFESSVVGFGLLLRGAAQTGKLDHQLVLNLAQHAKSPDSNNERARFVRLVQEAKRAAGL